MVARLTKRPIPKTRPKWEAEVKGLSRMIAEAEQLELDEGKEWVDNMVRYNKERLKDLYAHPPPCLRGKEVKIHVTVELEYL